ncbi:uncharacterized protein LOC118598426, partial [Oryzias melastigma]|uniref:uncharacterized protein LOC118598426 n=1 Tax=Oryzias melastigma TaxID=30732 RepID=UPI00168D9999
MPRKGKKSQAAKTRWQKVSVSSDASQNANEGSIDIEMYNIKGKSQQSTMNEVEVQHDAIATVCLQASRSQNSKKYMEFSRNKQCTCNSLTFLAFLYENESINITDLDNILDQGDQMYQQIRKRITNENYLALDELSDQVTARTQVYNVNTELPLRFGMFQDLPSEDANFFLDLEAGLSCLLSDVQYALLLMSSLCIAVFRNRSGRYGFFDPHTRTRSGLPVLEESHDSGTAVMLTFTHLSDMVATLSYSALHSDPASVVPPVKDATSSCIGKSTTQPDRKRTRKDVHDQNHDKESTTHKRINRGHSLCDASTVQTDDGNMSSGIDVDSIISVILNLLPSNNSTDDALHLNEDHIHINENMGNNPLTIPNSSDKVSTTISKYNKNRRKKVQRALKKSIHKECKKDQLHSEEMLKRRKREFSKFTYYDDPKVQHKKRSRITYLYRNNPDFTQSQKQYSTKRYHQCAEFQKKKKESVMRRYQKVEKIRLQQKRYMTERYNKDPEFKQKQKQFITERYRNNADFKRKQKQFITERYRNNADFKRKQKQFITERYRKNPDFKNKQKQYITERYRNDPDFREKQKLCINARYQQCASFREKRIQY